MAFYMIIGQQRCSINNNNVSWLDTTKLTVLMRTTRTASRTSNKRQSEWVCKWYRSASKLVYNQYWDGNKSEIKLGSRLSAATATVWYQTRVAAPPVLWSMDGGGSTMYLCCVPCPSICLLFNRWLLSIGQQSFQSILNKSDYFKEDGAGGKHCLGCLHCGQQDNKIVHTKWKH